MSWREKVKGKIGPPKNAKASASRKKADDKASPKVPTAKAPRPGVVQVYYDPNTSAYYAPNLTGEYQRWPKDELNLLLRRNGYLTSYKHDDGLNFLEAERLRITLENSVSYAGSLGGYQPGLYEVHASKILVTRGPKLIQPAAGAYSNLLAFLTALLGDEARYFCGWLKVATSSLRRGFPWAPGQLLAIAGPPGAGKSTLQSLLTPLLGGRVSSPWDYLAGKTNFNAHIYAAEHGLIGDVNPDVGARARRSFGASIKKLVAEPVHDLHAKGRTSITLTPFLRISMTLNDEPNSLHVLPPLDSDVAGKIMLLKSRQVDFKTLTKKFADWHAYYHQLIAELPAFLFYLRRWSIPASIQDARYGVCSYHSPDLVAAVQDLSKEQHLLNVIDTYIFEGKLVDHWTGTATQLEKLLSEKMKPSEIARLFSYATESGVLLSILAKERPDRVQCEIKRSRTRVYTIVDE